MPTLKLPLGGEVEYRGMRGRDEDILLNQKKMQSGEGLDEILANCTVRLKESDAEDAKWKEKVSVEDIQRMLSPDKMALLLAVRRESFGDEQDVEVQCGECGEKSTFTVDLAQVPSKPAPEEPRPYEVKLSDGTRVTFDFPNGKKEAFIARQRENIVTLAMLTRLVTVEGVDRNGHKEWLLDLPVRLRKELQKAMESKDCGPDTEAEQSCPICGGKVRFHYNSSQSFLYPER